MTEPDKVTLQKAVDIIRKEAGDHYMKYQADPNAPFTEYEKYNELLRIAREVSIVVEGL